MRQETINIIKLIAADGMTLTNGDVRGKTIYLGANDKAENWHEITDEEAAELEKAEEAESIIKKRG